MSEATFGGEQSAGPRGADLQTEGARVCPASKRRGDEFGWNTKKKRADLRVDRPAIAPGAAGVGVRGAPTGERQPEYGRRDVARSLPARLALESVDGDSGKGLASDAKHGKKSRSQIAALRA